MTLCFCSAASLPGCFLNDDFRVLESPLLPAASDATPQDTSSPTTGTTPKPTGSGVDEPDGPIVTPPATSLPRPEDSAPNIDAGSTAPSVAPSKPPPAKTSSDAATSSDDDEPALEDAAASPTAPPTDTDEVDASAPPLAAPCARYSTYDDPQPFAGLGLEGMNVWSPSLTADRLELYLAVSNPDDEMLYVARRDAPDDDFSAAEPLDELNSSQGRDGTPAISADGLTLAFYSTRASESRDLWLATRESRSEPFSEPIALDDLNTQDREHLPWLSADGMTLLYTSDAEPTLGNRDIRIATRTSRHEPFIGGVQLAGANSALNDDRAAFNANGLIVYFASDRDSEGSFDIYYASRPDLDSDFEDAQRLVTQNTDNEEVDVTLARDNLEILYVSDASGENQVLHAFRTCLEQ